jgi:hypothetical protein
MAYERKVERAHPTLIQMILDDSGSMSSTMVGTSDTRYQWVERYAGTILTELLARSTDVSGANPTVRPRYYLDVIKYGSTVEPWSSEELDIGEAATKFDAAKGTFGLGGNLQGTDTALAFQTAYDRLQVMINKERYRNSFPPMIFHLTDGESHTDAEAIARQASALATTDGNVLVCNAYIGAQTDLEYTDHRDFPGYVTEAEVGSNGDNLRLFRMSSVVPETIRQNLISDGIFPALRQDARLFFDVRTKEMLKHVLQVVSSGGSRIRK